MALAELIFFHYAHPLLSPLGILSLLSDVEVWPVIQRLVPALLRGNEETAQSMRKMAYLSIPVNYS